MHYGVLGMKWGVRRYQNKDGSLTSAGKKHQKTQKDNVNNKEIAKKILIGASLATTVAVGAYVCNRYLKKYGNATIKAGADFQHMSKKVDAMLDKPFYASYLKSDNVEYAKADFFGSHWTHKNTLTSSTDLKIAGKKVAEDTFVEFVRSNPEALKKIKSNVDLSDTKSLKKAYNAFNRNFNSPDMYDRALRDDYFSRLKEKGFDAVRDVNDQLYSGMISPIIVFNRFGNIRVKDIQQVNR